MARNTSPSILYTGALQASHWHEFHFPELSAGSCENSNYEMDQFWASDVQSDGWKHLFCKAERDPEKLNIRFPFEPKKVSPTFVHTFPPLHSSERRHLPLQPSQRSSSRSSSRADHATTGQQGRYATGGRSMIRREADWIELY